MTVPGGNSTSGRAEGAATKRPLRRRGKHQTRHPVIRAIRIAVGALLIVTGIVFTFIPVLPQISLIIAGLTLLAPECALARRLLMMVKLRIRAWRRALRRRRESGSGGAGGGGSRAAGDGSPG